MEQTYVYVVETLYEGGKSHYDGNVTAASFPMAALRAVHDARNKAENKAAFDRMPDLIIRLGIDDQEGSHE